MGTTLTGTQINNTYDGLIKTTDNTAITATTKLISDGLGNDTCIKVGTAGTDFLGNVDFSAATVTGLPGGAAGLVSGTGTDSIKNADSLVTNPATASGNCSIAIGDGADGICANSIALGGGSESNALGAVSLGVGAGTGQTLTAEYAINIGATTKAFACKSIHIGYGEPNCSGAGGARAIAIGGGQGYGVEADGNDSIAIGSGGSTANSQTAATGAVGIAIGNNARQFGTGSIAMGQLACAGAQFSTILGRLSKTNSQRAIGIGNAAEVFANDGIAMGSSSCVASGATCGVAIGYTACVAGTASNGVAIGFSADATASSAVALGTSVIASTANTVSVQALETQTASTPTAGGIIMNDAGSVARRLNIDASGNLQIDSTPVGGGGGAAGLVSGTGTDSIKNADSLVTNPATASGNCSIAIGDAASAGLTSVAIGTSATAPSAGTALGNGADAGPFAISIGDSSSAPGSSSIGMGYNSNALSTCSIAMGNTALVNPNATGGIAIGHNACVQGASTIRTGQIAIGCNTRVVYDGIAIGGNAQALGSKFSLAIGCGAQDAFGSCNVAIGYLSGVGAPTVQQHAVMIGTSAKAALCAVALGANSFANANSAVALGYAVTATRTNTVTGCQMEACVAGKGIVVTSPDGLTTLGIGIDNTGAIVTYTP